MDAFSAKNYTLRNAPRYIRLLGDKSIRPEPAQHIIEFPGGAIEVSRTTEGNYWAHILVNNEQFAEGDGSGYTSARGEVINARVGRSNEKSIASLERLGDVYQIAVLVRSVKLGA